LSLVVLPFQNLSGDPNEDYLADGVTDDLTTGLSHIPEAFVIANASARTYKGKAVDARQIGRDLGVRYVVEGSTRRAGTALRVNVQLISTETGAHVWSDRFDEPIADLAGGQDAILARMRGTLGVSLIEIEVARGLRTPQAAPDAFDLILRARALRNQPYDRQRFREAQSLYEQALRLDPSSVLALTGAAAMLLETRPANGGWLNIAHQKYAEELVTRARKVAPAAEEVLGIYAAWLEATTDCRQSMPAARQMIETYPNPTYGYGILSNCLIITGRAEEAIPLMEKVIRLNPRDTYIARRFNVMGSAHLFLGHNDEAITWLERTLAVDPGRRDRSNGGTKRKLTIAYARAGKHEEARRMLAAADADWPYDTVRGHFPDDINPVFAAQVREYQEGLRRAGERDHADEDANFGVPPDDTLHSDLAGYTPMTTPGAATVRTFELPQFITDRKPIIIDTLTYFWGRSISGAVGLKDAGIGGDLTDNAQDRLGRKMAGLTGGDLFTPVVAVGWNSERFDGRNLALRLVALGYNNVYWYRGGREAWEVAGLPETDLVPQEW
jgi:TolB-like protein